MKSVLSKSFLLICVILLLTQVHLSEQRRGGRGGNKGRGGGRGRGGWGRGRGGGRGRLPTCQNCFTSSKCFRGGILENVSNNCTSCIKNSKNYRPEPGFRSLKRAWRRECQQQCGTWNFYQREWKCSKCLQDCNKVKKRNPGIPTPPPNPKPCLQACQSNTSCFTRDETSKILSTFCLNYIRISCYLTADENGMKSDCILSAMTDPCSKCNVSSDNLKRFTNCANCVDLCKNQTICIDKCKDGNFPTSPVPCPFCAENCRLQSSSPQCNVTATCSECEGCNKCYDGCEENYKGDFTARPNTCEFPHSSRKGSKVNSLEGLLKFPSLKRRKPHWRRGWKY